MKDINDKKIHFVSICTDKNAQSTYRFFFINRVYCVRLPRKLGFFVGKSRNDCYLGGWCHSGFLLSKNDVMLKVIRKLIGFVCLAIY
jgi:hypothetical protein